MPMVITQRPVTYVSIRSERPLPVHKNCNKIFHLPWIGKERDPLLLENSLAVVETICRNRCDANACRNMTNLIVEKYGFLQFLYDTFRQNR